MAYSNSFLPPPMQNMLPNQQMPKIDPVQFRQFAMTLNDNSLSQLAQMAKQRGISDADIQAGINFIKSL
jgi:hypothetical protein